MSQSITNISVPVQVEKKQKKEKPPKWEKTKEYDLAYYEKNKEKMKQQAKKFYYQKHFNLPKELIEELDNDTILILGNAIKYIRELTKDEEMKKHLRTHIYPLILV
jgi:hypothetical protein